MKYIKLFSIAVFSLLIACTELPKIENVDLQKWKDDKDGCDGYRETAVSQIIDQKQKLRGLSQNEMIELLGPADKHQLYERSQKFFIYSLQANQNCDSYQGGYIKALYIRFNSLDQAVDFNIQKVK